MAAEKGSAFLLKMSDNATPANFTTIGGLRTTSLAINSETVDITSKQSGGWRTLLSGAGIRSVSVAGAGIFTDSAAERQAQAAALAGDGHDYELAFESGDKFSGNFHITQLEYAGDFNGERNYSLRLESSGPVLFVAA